MERPVELNLLMDSITPGNPLLLVDEPPPKRNLELGNGKHISWQTPIHREAVKKALEKAE